MSTPNTIDWIPILKALADESRLRIIELLLKGPKRVGEISETLEISNYNASKHLRVLREANLVVMQKEGKTKDCSISPEFRKTLEDNQYVLDLGCCTFRFDQHQPDPQ